jgi:lipid-binding SYLF domain-containing protein
MAVDQAANSECYGANANSKSLLEGKVSPPAELAQLYQKLNALASPA